MYSTVALKPLICLPSLVVALIDDDRRDVSDDLDPLDVVVERPQLDGPALDQRARPCPIRWRAEACSLVMMSSSTSSRPCGTFKENLPWASGRVWSCQNEPSIRPKTELSQPPLGCPLLSSHCPSMTTWGKARTSSGRGRLTLLDRQLLRGEHPGQFASGTAGRPVAAGCRSRWA